MVVFFFQAEDGIRDTSVTGVQTCALPILFPSCRLPKTCTRSIIRRSERPYMRTSLEGREKKIGRASCRERV